MDRGARRAAAYRVTESDTTEQLILKEVCKDGQTGPQVGEPQRLVAWMSPGGPAPCPTAVLGRGRQALGSQGLRSEPAPPRALLPGEAGRQERQRRFPPTWVLRAAGKAALRMGLGRSRDGRFVY